MCMYVHVCVCHVFAHAGVCALLVFKSQYLDGVHNFYFSFTQILFFYLLNLGFVVAIICSIKSGPK